jgi:DNA-binding NtrC family response regulator
MAPTAASVDDASAFPPIVLLVEDDVDMLDMYSTYFQGEGVWVGTAVSPDKGIEAVNELHPDVVISDIGFGGEPTGVNFVQVMKDRPEMRGIPLIVLSGLPVSDLPAGVRHDADIYLRKPVSAQALLDNVRRLLESKPALQQRNDRARARAARTRITQAAPAGETPQVCPNCCGPLEWIEQKTIGGSDYDYYHWCGRGCGLYCFDRGAKSWLKLA